MSNAGSKKIFEWLGSLMSVLIQSHIQAASMQRLSMPRRAAPSVVVALASDGTVATLNAA